MSHWVLHDGLSSPSFRDEGTERAISDGCRVEVITQSGRILTGKVRDFDWHTSVCFWRIA